jgi:hypothetical protein
MQQGRRRPSPRGLLIATVRSALGEAARAANSLPVFAGGKSMGGRMTSLADLDQLTPLCSRLGERATLRVIENVDHSFHVQKRSGRSDDKVQGELAGSISRWMFRHA